MLNLFIPSPASIITLAVVGGFFALLLTIAKLRLKVEKDERIHTISALLPGANCGGCGAPGCVGYATLIVSGKAAINQCPVGGNTLANKIAEIMGVEGKSSIRKIARIHCQGGHNVAKSRFKYDGPLTCSAANLVSGGPKSCIFGCLGYGDCYRSCKFDAIVMDKNGLPQIIEDKCTACGACVKACPKNIISLVPFNSKYHVSCLNTEKTPVMKKSCSVGCIGCKLCEKACEKVFLDNKNVRTAITVENFLAKFDYQNCISCGECFKVCPQKVINKIE